MNKPLSGGFLQNSQPIRAILFDLDGTLRFNRPNFNDIVVKYATEYGAVDTRKNRSRAERWLHYYWAQSPDALLDQEIYGDQSKAFWENHTRRYLIAFGLTPDRAAQVASEIYSRMNAEYKPQSWVPPDVFEALLELRNAGYLIGIVSNRNKPLNDELNTLGLEGYIDFNLTAGEANSWKPDPGIFLDAVNRLQILPSEALYVGDNYYSDVIGATNAGLHPVLLDPEGTFADVECDVIRKLDELIHIAHR